MYPAFQTIKCECGIEVVKDYLMAGRMTEYPTTYFVWMCQYCGRSYKEKQKEPIKLT